MHSLSELLKEAKTVSNDLSIQILWMTTEGIEPTTLAAHFGCTTTSIQKRYKRALREICPHIFDQAQGRWMKTIQMHKAQIQCACIQAHAFFSEPLRENDTKSARIPKPTHIPQVGIRLTPKESMRITALAKGRKPTTVAKELLLQALNGTAKTGATPVAAHINPKTEIGLFSLLFQLSTEQDLEKRIQVVQTIVTHIPGLHEMSLEELTFLLEDPKAVEFIRQRSNKTAA